MSVLRSFSTAWRTLRADSSTGPNYNKFSAATVFMPAGSIESARATIETRNRMGLIEIIGAANFANVENSPNDTAKALGASWISSDTLTFPGGFSSLSSDTEAAQLFRLGFQTRLSTGSTLGSIDARARFDLLINESIGSAQLPHTAVTVDSTSAAFFPCGDWVLAGLIAKARAVQDLVNTSGNVDIALGYQTCDTTLSPSGGTALSSYTSHTGTGMAFPTVFNSLSVSDKQLVRFGWMVKLPSGSTRIYARVGGVVEFGR